MGGTRTRSSPAPSRSRSTVRVSCRQSSTAHNRSGSNADKLFDEIDVQIDAASIDTNVEARDQDLRSARFFDVANFPTLAFRGRECARNTTDEWVVTGDLTIRGIARTVPLTLTMRGARTDQHGNTRLGLGATAELLRSDFDLTTELLQESGTGAGPDIELEINLEAILQR